MQELIFFRGYSIDGIAWTIMETPYLEELAFPQTEVLLNERLEKFYDLVSALKSDLTVVKTPPRTRPRPNELITRVKNDLGVFADVRLVFQASSSNVLAIEVRKDGAHLYTPLLTEGPGVHPGHGINQEGKWRDTDLVIKGHALSDAVPTRVYTINGQPRAITFTEWLRLHDITGGNFLDCTRDRRVELWAAFFAGQTFQGVRLEMGNSNVGVLELGWNESHENVFNYPAWVQLQTGGTTGFTDGIPPAP